VDAGQIRLTRPRPRPGPASRKRSGSSARSRTAIREIVPDSQRAMILDNIGLTQSFTIMAYIDNGTVSHADGEILVALAPEHRPTADFVAKLRTELPRRFPVGARFFFEPADITSQILNFGLPAPIDVQVVGVNREANLVIGQKLRAEIAKVPGIADVHIHQMTDRPDLRLDVDRIMASELGLTQQGRRRQRAGVAQLDQPGGRPTSGSTPSTASTTAWPRKPRRTTSTPWTRC